MPQPTTDRRYEIVDFSGLPPTECPCGTARQAFAAASDFPATIHQTEIALEAQSHYHRRLTEVYYISECGPEARMELDGELVPLSPGSRLARPSEASYSRPNQSFVRYPLPK